jgi:hypothetical protein
MSRSAGKAKQPRELISRCPPRAPLVRLIRAKLCAAADASAQRLRLHVMLVLFTNALARMTVRENRGVSAGAHLARAAVKRVDQHPRLRARFAYLQVEAVAIGVIPCLLHLLDEFRGQSVYFRHAPYPFLYPLRRSG